jgi:hypothetical protein
MDPGQMPAFLAARGHRLLEDTGANEFRARYWGARGRRMRGFAFYRVALAENIAGGPVAQSTSPPA